LRQELEKVGAAEGDKAFAMLDLHNPTLDWVHLAQGMGVEAVRVDTCRGFEAAVRSAMKARGPRLIEALV
jgi:acetolactate synthase-1/2/3 large subunit